MTVRELVRCVSAATGRRFVAENDSAQMIGQNYMTVICREGPVYYTIPGVARIGKGCNSISGDNFAMMELPGGKRAWCFLMGWVQVKPRAGRVPWWWSF